MRGFVVFLILGICALFGYAAEGNFPAIYETTSSLNVRIGDNTRAKKMGTLPANKRITVDYVTANNWGAVIYYNQRGYVSMQYLKYVGPVDSSTSSTTRNTSSKSKKSKSLWSWIITIGIWMIVIMLFRNLAIRILDWGSRFMYGAYWVVCIPFYCLNWLQRFLAKPWRIFYKGNSGRDFHNKELRERYQWAKIPLYILLTPLRFYNAVYYNMIIHCAFEMYNYVVEIFVPSNDDEGADDNTRLFLMIPWRFMKYVVWHGSLTFIESAIWTVVDTFVPALTLFHGTNEAASTTITHAGRNGYSCRLTGIWNVGSGNYAGNGIYFAPARSTALHYANGSLIVCRVSLGKVLDLGLAPAFIYRQCGFPNALGATKWGLQNGYVTGEWWRKDRGWWEYCMYDWKNRYNYSWRIRPLYVLNLYEKSLQRIPGGMCHWLFRKLVIEDILTYLDEKLE